jgi:adenosine deaminase
MRGFISSIRSGAAATELRAKCDTPMYLTPLTPLTALRSSMTFSFSGTSPLAPYPLKAYLDKGLRVTVNADNPGISRTDFTNELHRGARMTPGGLSVWDILLLIRNGFKAAFSRRPLRQKLLRRAESEILALIREGLPS